MEPKLLHYVFMDHYLYVFDALAFGRLKQNLIFGEFTHFSRHVRITQYRLGLGQVLAGYTQIPEVRLQGVFLERPHVCTEFTDLFDRIINHVDRILCSDGSGHIEIR